MKTMNKKPCVFLEDTRRDLKGMTRRQAFNSFSRPHRTAVYGAREEFSVFYSEYRIEVMGNNIFWKSLGEESMTFKNGKFYGTFSQRVLNIALKAFNIDWPMSSNWIIRLLARNKTLWAMILKGKITNPEQLAKKYSKLYFKGVYSYKALKVYFESYSSIGSLWDIYYYTSNPNLWIEKYCALKWENDHQYEEHLNLAVDVLHYAKMENSKVNPTWSYARMASEHQKQIERDNLSLINTYSDEKIATPFERAGLQLILDERDAFTEGTVMHNCVHSCYWNRIANGNYLIAKGVVDGVKIDVGISIGYSDNGDVLRLNQVHSIYNGIVSQEIKQYCMNWIDAYHQDLLGVLNEIRKSELPKLKADLDDLDALAALRARLRGDMPAPEEIDLPF